MAVTPTTNIPLGFKAPEFSLPRCEDGREISNRDVFGSKGTVVVFMCNHCPFVIHILKEMVAVAREYMPKGIGFVAISSNDIANYPQDAPPMMKKLKDSHDFPFEYLYDANQAVAKSYDAACTPDFSVFDAEQKAVYRGQFDDSRPGSTTPVDGHSLRSTLDLLSAGLPVPAEGQIPSIGCNIKWISES